MYKCARGASCAYHQLPRPAASHQMRGLIDFCTTPVTRQSHSILRGRTIKGRRSTKSCTGRLTQNALRCKLIKIASTNVIIVSVCCVSFSFSTAITSLKSHLSLHLRAKNCNFPIAAAIRNPTEIVFFSHDWISKGDLLANRILPPSVVTSRFYFNLNAYMYYAFLNASILCLANASSTNDNRCNFPIQ